MPSNSIIFNSTYLFVVALLLCSGGLNVLGQTSDVRDCQDYTGANTTSATCNDEPGVICSGGCTGYVTAHNCTRSQKVNDPEPPLTSEKCTLGFGKSSATMYICITEQFSFTCYGGSTGKAQCKGCHKSNSTSQTVVSPSGSMNGNNSTNGNMGMPMTPPSTNTSSASSTNIGTTGSSGTNSTPTGSASTKGFNILALLAASLFPSALLW